MPLNNRICNLCNDNVIEDEIHFLLCQGFSLASAIGHSPKIVPDVREFAVKFGQFVRDDFRKSTLYGYAQ